MTAEGHLLFSIACAVFAKNAELTPVLAQGDWWHIVPFRNPDVFVTGHRSPKVVSWAAIKMDIKTDRPALLGIVVLPTVCWRYLRCWQPFTLRFRKAGSFRLMRYKEWCWVI